MSPGLGVGGVRGKGGLFHFLGVAWFSCLLASLPEFGLFFFFNLINVIALPSLTPTVIEKNKVHSYTRHYSLGKRRGHESAVHRILGETGQVNSPVEKNGTFLSGCERPLTSCLWSFTQEPCHPAVRPGGPESLPHPQCGPRPPFSQASSARWRMPSSGPLRPGLLADGAPAPHPALPGSPPGPRGGWARVRGGVEVARPSPAPPGPASRLTHAKAPSPGYLTSVTHIWNPQLPALAVEAAERRTPNLSSAPLGVRGAPLPASAEPSTGWGCGGWAAVRPGSCLQ